MKHIESIERASVTVTLALLVAMAGCKNGPEPADPGDEVETPVDESSVTTGAQEVAVEQPVEEITKPQFLVTGAGASEIAMHKPAKPAPKPAGKPAGKKSKVIYLDEVLVVATTLTITPGWIDAGEEHVVQMSGGLVAAADKADGDPHSLLIEPLATWLAQDREQRGFFPDEEMQYEIRVDGEVPASTLVDVIYTAGTLLYRHPVITVSGTQLSGTGNGLPICTPYAKNVGKKPGIQVVAGPDGFTVIPYTAQLGEPRTVEGTDLEALASTIEAVKAENGATELLIQPTMDCTCKTVGDLMKRFGEEFDAVMLSTARP